MPCSSILGPSGPRRWDLLAVESPFEYTPMPTIEKQGIGKDYAIQRAMAAQKLVSLAHRSLLTGRCLRAFTEIDREPGHGDEHITSLLGFSLRYFTRPWDDWMSWREQLSLMFENTSCPVIVFSGGLLRYSKVDYTQSLAFPDGINIENLDNKISGHSKTHAVLSGCVSDRAGFVFEHLVSEGKRPIIIIEPQSSVRDIRSGRGMLDLQAYYQVVATYPIKTKYWTFRSVLTVKKPRADQPQPPTWPI
jgi:hypothetical protein